MKGALEAIVLTAMLAALSITMLALGTGLGIALSNTYGPRGACEQLTVSILDCAKLRR